MKTLLLILVLVTLTFTVNAQTIVSKYISVLSVNTTDNQYYNTNYVSLWSGGKIQTNITESTDLTLIGAYHSDDPGFSAFWLDQKISVLNLRFGIIPRPIAIANRPSPAEYGSHFETSPQAAIPGMSPGVNLSTSFGVFKFSGALHYVPKQKVKEYNIGVGVVDEKFSIETGAYLSDSANGIGGTIKLFDFKTIFYQSTLKNSNFFRYGFSDYGLFLAHVNDKKNKANDVLTLGLVKDLKTQYENVEALFGAGYSLKWQTFHVYIWVYYH